ADRPMRGPSADAARREAEAVRDRLAAVDAGLARFEPVAGSGTERPRINARRNVDRFAPRPARRVRLTIRATNRLEPCLDELEVFNPAGENVALTAAGASTSASGSIAVADRHDLAYLND